MEKVIKIDLVNESDIIEKYDSDKISQDLLEYLIKKCEFTRKDDKIKIVINNKCQTKLKYQQMLYEAFKEEYANNLKSHVKTNILQIVLLILGIVFIFMSFQITNEVWKEIFLIGGWVPIWEMVDLELFNDVRGIKRKKTLLKLIDSEIVEN